MTDTVTFQNPGLIPMEAVTTMGVSVKDGDNPIGYFGTGLKYAIASLLRTGQKMTIWRGLDRHDFEVQQEEVRGKAFGFIYMEMPSSIMPSGTTKQRLGFTTHLGARWEMWQVFRELHSNALDEGGTSSVARKEPREGWTTIWATGAQIADAAAKRAETFLETAPLAVLPGLEIHPGKRHALYYRGVKVDFLPKASAFTYNVTSPQDLTEDRTIKSPYWFYAAITGALSNCEDETILGPVLTNIEGWENGLRFDSSCPAFHEVALRLIEKHGHLGVNPNAVAEAERWAKTEGRVRRADLTAQDYEDIQAAKAFLEAIGYAVDYPIVVADSLGPGIFGMAKNETIYLARTVLDRGGNFLISTLLEERLHLSHDFKDNSRAFQDFLLDMAVKFAGEARRVAVPRGRESGAAGEPILLGVDLARVEEMPF